MKEEDYPNYFQAADKLSIGAQKKYLRIIKIDLILMVFAVLLLIYNIQDLNQKYYIYIIMGLALFLALISSIILKNKNYEDIWYQSRSLAESCKTLTWRFIMCSEYFEIENTIDEVKNKFIERMQTILNEFKELQKHMDSKILTQDIITPKMLDIREYPLYERKTFYIENRIDKQKEWYATKAEFNREKYDFWFWVIIISQVLAIISVVFLILIPSSNWNFVGLLTTIAASVISWLKIKQYQELKQSYTIASGELNFIKALSDNVHSDQGLSEFVLDSENAISREHTLWVAQRRK